MHRKEDNIHVARFGPDPASGHRESVAAVLSQAREEHGQDLRSVSQVLRIRQSYLEALESGDFDKLPGTAYALGFLRTYAEYLGLNANNIVDRYKQEALATERPTELVFPEPVAEGRIPGGAIILISVVLLTVAYGGWFYLANQGRTVADLVPALPEQIQTLIDSERDSDRIDPAPAAPEPPVVAVEAPSDGDKRQVAETSSPREPAPVPAQGEAQPSAEAPRAAPSPARIVREAELKEPEQAPLAQDPGARPAETSQIAVRPRTEIMSDSSPEAYSGPPIDPDPSPELETSSQVEAPSAVSEAVEARIPSQQFTPEISLDQIVRQTVVIPAPPPAPQNFSRPGERAPQVYGEGNEGARIVLRAIQDSWVQVRDNQDALLLTRVLRSGDVYRVPDQNGLTLLTGNAGGLQLEVDGIRLAPLGPIGAVRRQIALDPSILLAGGTQ